MTAGWWWGGGSKEGWHPICFVCEKERRLVCVSGCEFVPSFPASRMEWCSSFQLPTQSNCPSFQSLPLLHYLPFQNRKFILVCSVFQTMLSRPFIQLLLLSIVIKILKPLSNNLRDPSSESHLLAYSFTDCSQQDKHRTKLGRQQQESDRRLHFWISGKSINRRLILPLKFSPTKIVMQISWKLQIYLQLTLRKYDPDVTVIFHLVPPPSPIYPNIRPPCSTSARSTGS